MAIPKEQARALFTQTFLGPYKEQTPNSNFLQSFFADITTQDKLVSIEVQRNSEKIATDVIRGTGPNWNSFNRSTEKKWQPPFYNEGFDATSLDRYDIAFGQNGSPNKQTIKTTAREIQEKLDGIRKKIERAKEKQASQVLETGIVELQNAESIDFKRKADSKVDNTGDPWNNTGAAVEAQLIAAGDFIRQKGKNNAAVLNLIMSSDVFLALKETDFFKNNANYQQIQLIDVNMPQASIGGSKIHGRITAGAYQFDLWTYDETYEDSTGTTQYYWPRKYACVIPQNGSRFEMVHAGVPAIIADKNNAEFPQYIASMEARYWMNNYIDANRKAHIFDLSSAPLTIPVTIDMIYTMKVLTENKIG